MNHSKYLKAVIIIISTILLAACNRDVDKNVNVTDNNIKDLSDDVNSAQNSGESDGSDSVGGSDSLSDTSGAVDNGGTEGNPSGVNVAQITTRFQSFLNGRDEVYFDRFSEEGNEKVPDWIYENIAQQLIAAKGYTLGDFAEGLSVGTAEYFEQEVKAPKSIVYAFIDCGNDGIPELALRFDEVGNENISSNFIVIIKEIEGKLQCIFQGEYSYRSYATVNEYGYYEYGGANGAVAHTSEFTCINDRGEPIFLYYLNYMMNAYALYVPDAGNYLEVAEDEGIASNIQISQYSFETFDYNLDYSDYITKCAYVVIPTDDNGRPLEGEELKKNEEAYEKFWKVTGLTRSTEEEVDAKITDIMKKAGVTDTIKNGEDVDWTALPDSRMSQLFAWSEKYAEKKSTIENP